MKIINLDIEKNLKIIVPTDGPIGVSLSGGCDSALLSYILMKNLKNDIHFFTITNRNKNFANLNNSINVVKKCIELTNKLNVFHHIEYFEEQKRTLFFNSLQKKIDLKIVDIIYQATTNTPPLDDRLKFKYQLDQDIADRRDPNKIKEYFSYNNKICNPFINTDKKEIKKLYEKFNLVEDLYPLTRSCESFSIFDKHCNDCWWCEERKWAFGYLE